MIYLLPEILQARSPSSSNLHARISNIPPGPGSKYGFDFSYTCEDVAILGFSEDFETYPDLKNYTVKEYGELTIEYGEFGSDVRLQEQDGLNYFEFVSDEYKYFACVYKTEKAFWVIQFATDTAQYDSYRSDFDEWARTVEFAE